MTDTLFVAVADDDAEKTDSDPRDVYAISVSVDCAVKLLAVELTVKS